MGCDTARASTISLGRCRVRIAGTGPTRTRPKDRLRSVNYRHFSVFAGPDFSLPEPGDEPMGALPKTHKKAQARVRGVQSGTAGGREATRRVATWSSSKRPDRFGQRQGAGPLFVAPTRHEHRAHRRRAVADGLPALSVGLVFTRVAQGPPAAGLSLERCGFDLATARER